MKPSDFMIGLVNFLSIFVPGAIATVLLIRFVPQLQNLVDFSREDGALSWILLFAAAYFLGHLIFLLGSWLDWSYDQVRKRRHPYRENDPFFVATRLRQKVMSETEFEATNTFQWCRALLIQNCPGAQTDVEVHEADQKFFRSLVVLALAVVLVSALAASWITAGTSMAIAIASFVRFYNRRLKTVVLAYTHVIILHRSGKLNFKPIEGTHLDK